MGLIFASMGIISCIVPGILVPCLTLIIALLNIGGGVIPLVKMIHSRSRKKGRGSADVPSIIKKLFLTQSTLNILSIVFGVSMLINNLIPGPVIGVVLTANGIVLLYLISILAKIDEMKKALA